MSSVLERHCQQTHKEASWPMDRPERADRIDYEAKDPGLVRSFCEYVRNFEIKIQELLQEQRFKRWSSRWKADTAILSNVAAKVLHPAYQSIMAMGMIAVPLILQDLETNGPTDWFWALYHITQVNPITDDIAGNMAAMTEAWLQWGRKEGHLKASHRKLKRAFRA